MKLIKVGIDVSMLAYQGSGVATYTFNLVKNLLLIDNKNQYRLFYSSLRRPKNFYYLDELRRLGAKVFSYRLPFRTLKSFWSRAHVMPVEYLIGKVDIFHSSDYLRPPLMAGTKSITTLHDLTWKIFPHYHTAEVINAHQNKIKKTIQYQDVILADSQQTKNDFSKHYPKAKNAVFIVPLGVDKKFFEKYPKVNTNQMLKKYRIKQPYLLYVGAIEPRKNIDVLVQAFKLVLTKFPSLNLILAGRAGWNNEVVFATVKKLKLESRVRFIGFVNDQDLPLVYQAAKLFVYPSSYEGFGLPPLESLAAGTPIVAYNCPSLPGSAQKDINNTTLSRDILKQLRSPAFPKEPILSWEQVARKTLAIYQKTVTGKL